MAEEDRTSPKAAVPDTPSAQPNQIIVADSRGRVRTFDGPVAATIRHRITDSL